MGRSGISGGRVGGTPTGSLGGGTPSGAGDGTPIGSGKGVSPGCGGRPGAGLGSAGVGSGKGWLGNGMFGTRHSPKMNGSARSAANRRPFLSCRSSRALVGAALRLSGATSAQPRDCRRDCRVGGSPVWCPDQDRAGALGASPEQCRLVAGSRRRCGPADRSRSRLAGCRTASSGGPAGRSVPEWSGPMRQPLR